MTRAPVCSLTAATQLCLDCCILLLRQQASSQGRQGVMDRICVCMPWLEGNMSRAAR